MALLVADHIHIGLNNPPTTTYFAVQGGLDHSQEVPITYERGITGLLHIHRLEDGITAGKPIQFDADKLTIVLRGTNVMTDLTTLKGLSGQLLYYVPNYHDDDEDGGGSLLAWPNSDYVKRCVLVIQPGSVTNTDPMMTMWSVQIELVDHDKVTS